MPNPVAAFSASETTVAAGTDVLFTDASTGNITKWTYTFGDGTSEVFNAPPTAPGGANPRHAWASPGKKTVTLMVEGPDGNDREVKTGYITVT